ncbi:hypothetical protein EI94DRAFT_1833075 [Lactarius quietus]|nr:hypothetical protein EI94DRAFT_1833075 [Lactarius quietus]
MGNVIMQGEMQYPQHVDVPNYYNAAHYYPPPGPPPQYPEDPHMYWNVEAVEAVPAQAQPFPRSQRYKRIAMAFMAMPHPAPPADMPPANGLRDLAGRFFNNPEAHVITLRIEPGPRGRFEVLIALELADLF